MHNDRRNVSIASILILTGAIAPAHAQCVASRLTPPTLDRWAYPFNSTPGVESQASTFGAINQPGFDDRDAQFLLGWDTASLVPTGLPESRYAITRARVTIWVSISDRFFYDPTPDPVASLYDLTDPQYVPDADPGRPVELFAVGYRNGASSATFTETSPLSPFPPFPPQEGVRSVFAALVDTSGSATDISRQVRQRFDATPMAIGLCEGITPGAQPPAGTAMTFEINLASPEASAYLARGLREGRLRFIVSSLEPAAGGPGGGTGTPTYPAFYTKENALAGPLGYTAALDLSVSLTPPTDLNEDGNADQDDVRYLVNVIGGGDNPTGIDPDLNADGNADQDDVAFLVNLIAGGTGCP